MLSAGHRTIRAGSGLAKMAGVRSRGGPGSGSGGDFAGFGISDCGFLIGYLGRTPPPRRRLLEPVAFAVQLQNIDMVGEAIEQHAGQPLAVEDASPFLKWKIRRDDSRAAFVTLAEYFKQQLRAGLRERHITEFVNDQQFDGGELGLKFEKPPLVARFH